MWTSRSLGTHRSPQISALPDHRCGSARNVHSCGDPRSVTSRDESGRRSNPRSTLPTRDHAARRPFVGLMRFWTRGADLRARWREEPARGPPWGPTLRSRSLQRSKRHKQWPPIWVSRWSRYEHRTGSCQGTVHSEAVEECLYSTVCE